MALALPFELVFVGDASLYHVLGKFELPLYYKSLHNLICDIDVKLFLTAVIDNVINYRVLLSFNTPPKDILHQFSKLRRWVPSIKLLEGGLGELS